MNELVARYILHTSVDIYGRLGNLHHVMEACDYPSYGLRFG